MARWTLLFLMWAMPAYADGSIGVLARASNFGEGALVDARWRAGAAQVGVEGYVGREREAFIAGLAVEDALRIDVGALLMVQVWEHDISTFSLSLRAGMRRLQSAKGNDEVDSSWAVRAELGALFHHDVHERVVLRTGVLVPLLFQVDPEFSNDINGGLITGGFAVQVHNNLHLTADLDLGGIFGADGDAGKFIARGTVGLRWARDWRHF